MASGNESAGEGSDRATAGEAASQPPSPTFLPPRLQRHDTASSTMSVSNLLPGFYEMRIHGSCPNCKHWHRTATAQISRDPAKFSGVRCQNCNKRWFGIGGNSSHPSFASVETLPEAEWIESPSYSALRNALLVSVQAVSAVGSGIARLPVVEENTSPTSHRSRQGLHSRDMSTRSNIDPPSSATKAKKDDEDVAAQETPPAEVKHHPIQTTSSLIGKPRASRYLNLEKTKSRIKDFKKKCESMASRITIRLRLSKIKSKLVSKGKGKAVEPNTTPTVQQDKPQPKADDIESKDVADAPEKEYEPEESRDTSKGKGKAKEEPSSSGSATGHAETNGNPSPQPLPPLSELQGLKREDAIRYMRQKLTELSACTCGPACGPECRCRHHGRSFNPFYPGRSQDDSVITYETSRGYSDPPIPQMPQEVPGVSGGLINSADFGYFGVQFDQAGSEYPRSIASGLSNRYSIGAITTASTRSSNFSTARTYVGSERGMTATSPPVGMLRARPQSFPRPRSRSPRLIPPPMSSLRISTFPHRDEDNNASSSADRRDGLQDLENTERGRSRSHTREDGGEQGDEHIARQDHAPMVNGDGMRRQSEPTSSHA